MIRKQGTRATVYRGTPATAADGNRYLSPLTVLATDVPVNIQEPNADRAAMIWGTDFPVAAVAFADPDAITEEDRLELTAGPFLGEKYAVVGRIRHRQRSRNDHDELALRSEAFV